MSRTEAEIALRNVLSDIPGASEAVDERRDLFVTRAPTGYQADSDWIVIAVQGTPPRGLLLVDPVYAVAYSFGQGRCGKFASWGSSGSRYLKWCAIWRFVVERFPDLTNADLAKAAGAP